MIIGGKATPSDNNNMWVKNLYDPLVSLGHDVFLFDIDAYANQQGLPYMSVEVKERVSNELPLLFKQEHEKKPFDIFFSYLHNSQIIPSVLNDIKKEVYTINYSTNYHQFEMYKEVAGIVDYNIYISKIAKKGFDSLNVKSYWMPLAANPNFYQPDSRKNGHSVFVGSVYGPRAYLFWRLLQYDINLQLYGNGWLPHNTTPLQPVPEKKGGKVLINDLLHKLTGYELRKKEIAREVRIEDDLRMEYDSINQKILALLRRDFPNHLHHSLSDLEYVRVLAQAGTVVNIQESRFNHDYLNHQVLYGSNLRDYEATMCGSFLCTQYSDEIEELFQVGKEVVCYHNEHDLASKIKYYNSHTSERDRIAAAGYNKSIADHTWERRFGDFFSHLDLNVYG
jgi:spore maturation protein CgeB